MSQKSYQIQNCSVTTSSKVYYRNNVNGEEVNSHFLKNSDEKIQQDVEKPNKKTKSNKGCFKLCGIPVRCSRKENASFGVDKDKKPTKVKNRRQEQPCVRIISRRDIGTPTQTKKLNVDDFRDAALKSHNVYRKKHNSPKLTLSSNLNEVAQRWAVHLSESRTFQHSSSNFGENIYFAQRANGIPISAEDAVKSWYDECKQYSFARAGFSTGTGHFTQVVWKSSKELGIGVVQTSDGCTYVVANYNPAGNMIGEFEGNVLPIKN